MAQFESGPWILAHFGFLFLPQWIRIHKVAGPVQVPYGSDLNFKSDPQYRTDYSHVFLKHCHVLLSLPEIGTPSSSWWSTWRSAWSGTPAALEGSKKACDLTKLLSTKKQLSEQEILVTGHKTFSVYFFASAALKKILHDITTVLTTRNIMLRTLKNWFICYLVRKQVPVFIL